MPKSIRSSRHQELNGLARLGFLIARGLLKPMVGQTLPLEQAAQAHRLIEAGGRTGKIVLVTS